jgi:hypothetical protein
VHVADVPDAARIGSITMEPVRLVRRRIVQPFHQLPGEEQMSLKFGGLLLAVVVAAACQRVGPSARITPVTAPSTFFAILDHRAVEESASGLQHDFGPADVVAPTRNGAWVARAAGTCHSVIQLFDPAAGKTFAPRGAVSDIAVSEDGRWLAYGRGGTKVETGRMGGGCGFDALVIRDLRTGSERVWPGDAGSISSLSWSADGRRLVFETGLCCVGSPTPKELDVATDPVAVSDVPLIPAPGPSSTFVIHHPTFAGNQLLLLADDFGATSVQYRVITSAGKTVADLQEQGVGLDADPSGQHLLVSLYGEPGNLLSITTGAKIEIFGRGFDGARW